MQTLSEVKNIIATLGPEECGNIIESVACDQVSAILPNTSNTSGSENIIIVAILSPWKSPFHN